MDGQGVHLGVCFCCYEEKVEANRHFAIPNNEQTYICVECSLEHLVPKFREALRFEHHYPPSWATNPISVDSFADLLDQEFIDQYHAREVEYQTPPAQRVYCPIPLGEAGRCNGFIGSRGNAGRLCPQCGAGVCTNCEEIMILNTPHACPQRPRSEAPEATDEFAFNGVERGVEWQECPRCQIKVIRDEGCNEMTCRCGTHFCYLCGRDVPEGERHIHWTQAAGCQRYGDPAHPPEHADEAFDWDPNDHILDPAELNDLVTATMGPVGNNGAIFFGEGQRTPASDNDFLGAAGEQEEVPGIGMLSRAFDAIHDQGPATAEERLLNHDSLIVVQQLRDDRTTIHQSINQLMVALHAIMNPPPGFMVDPQQAGIFMNAINMCHALHALLNVMIMAFTNPNANLNDLAGALRLTRQELQDWQADVPAHILPPNVDEVQFVRGGEVDQVLEFIRRQQEMRATAAALLNFLHPPAGDEDTDRANEANPSDGPTPQAFQSP